MPDAIELLKHILKNKIEVNFKICDFTGTASLNIPNADQLLFKKSVLLDEDPQGYNEGNEG
jgi:hypothetical protein